MHVVEIRIRSGGSEVELGSVTIARLAGGGEACADIENLRAQRELFGDVASERTLYGTITGLGASSAALERSGRSAQFVVGRP